MNDFQFSYVDGMVFYGNDYSFAIPDGFEYKLGFENYLEDGLDVNLPDLDPKNGNEFNPEKMNREILVWKPKSKNKTEWKDSDLYIVVSLGMEQLFTSSKVAFGVMKEVYEKNKKARLRSYTYKKGKIEGGYIAGKNTEKKEEYDCILGETKPFRFKVRFNKKFNLADMDEAVKSWFETFQFDASKKNAPCVESKHTLSDVSKEKTSVAEKETKAKLDRIYAKYRRKITRSNDEILGNKPINRSNDSRIKVIINNTQELMQQYEEEVMNLAIQFEEKANLLNEYDEELVLVIDQIICCYEALKVGYEVEFLHWRKDIIKCSKSNSDSEIKKWKKKKEELPSMMLLKLEEKENELITKEKNIDNKIIQNQKKQKKHKESIDKLAEKINKNNDSIAEKITEREKIHKNIEKINAEELDIEKKIIDLRKQRDNLNENKTALEAEANSIQGEIDKCISSLNGIKTEYTQKRNSLKGEADRINFEKQTLFNLYRDYAERMEIEKKKAEKSFFLKKKHLREASIIEKSIESVNEQKAHLEDKLEDIEARHKNLDFSYEAKIKEIEDQIESLKDKENSIKEQISTTNNMIEDINESIISLSDTSEFNESKKKKCEDEIKEIQEQESQLIELNNSLSEEQTDLEKSLEDLEQQNQELQDKKKNIEMQVNENKQKEKEIKKKISEYKKNSENPV